MKLFELFATLALDTSEFDSGVTKSESKWNTFGEKLSGGISKVGNMAKSLYNGAFGGNLGAWIRNVADEASAAGDKIDKQSQALGMSRKAYQEWDYILSQSGASIDSMGVSMKTLNSAVLNTLADPKKNKDMVETFKELGLSMADLNGLTQESQFEKVVRAFQQLPAGAEKSALAVKLFGRNGQDLLPLLNSSADSIDEMRTRAEELGLIMSDDAVDAAVAYNDALDDMDRTFKAAKYTLGAEFLPMFTNMFNKVASYSGKLLNAYKDEGLSGVFKTLASDIGGAMANIPWPTWDQVKDGFKTAWNAIKDKAASSMILVFGENEEGGIRWPSLSEISTSATDWWTNDAWPAIKDIFGIDVDTSTAWHSVETFFRDIRTLVDENQGVVLGFFVALAAALLAINAPLVLITAGIALLAANWETLTEWVSAAWEAVTTFFGETIPSWISEKVQGIADAWNSVTGAIGSAIGALRDWLGLQGSAPEYKSTGFESLDTYMFQESSDGSGKTNWDVIQERKNALGFATGLDYVPYNEFPAYLHEGEAVLTKSEASEWRRGDGQQSFDVEALAMRFASSVRDMLNGAGVTMDGVTVGHIVAPTVSGDISGQAWAGRYR